MVRLAVLLFFVGWVHPAAAQSSRIVEAGADLHYVLSQAAPFDTLRFQDGIWNDNPYVIDKPLVLIGSEGTRLEAGVIGSIVFVRSDSVTISGIHFSGVRSSTLQDNAAILAEASNYCQIRDNRFDDNYFGIYLKGSDYCTVSRNTIVAYGSRETTSGNGIHLWRSRYGQVSGNNVHGHRDGMYLEHAHFVIVRDNHSHNNLRYGLHYMFSNDCEYRANLFEKNGAGVAVMYSSRVDMVDNIFRNNWGPTAYGLLLKDINDSKVTGNVISSNTTAIHSEGSNRLHFLNNRVHQNGRAVNLLASSLDNVFEGNDFTGNTLDVSTNSRQHFNHFRSNYWSAYSGYDLDRDGTGDVPHRPVRLFAYLVERNPVAMVLLRSLFVDLLEAAERVFPVLAPELLVDPTPSMKPHFP